LQYRFARPGRYGDAGGLAAPSAAGADRRVACHLEFEVTTGVVLALQVAPARTAGDLPDERLEVTIDERAPPLPVTELATDRAGRIHVIRAGAGRLAVSYQATIRPAGLPSPPVATDDGDAVFDAEAIAALRQSRY